MMHPKARKTAPPPTWLGLYRIEAERWGESADQYDAFEKKWRFYGTVADALLSRLPLKDDSKVLELACGTGVCTLKAASSVPRGNVVALDFSAAMLAAARKNAAEAEVTNVTFVQGDAGQISKLLKGRTFDFAVCNSAFWHFPEPERVLAGMRELLTSSGEFAVSIPSWVDPDDAGREEIRTKIRDILQKHGVRSDEIETRRRGERRREGLLPVFARCGFEVNETSFEFAVTPESRQEWRRISAFSGNRWWAWTDNLDAEVRKEIREAADEWRKKNVADGPLLSRWRLLVAHPLPGWSPK